jgi:HK97 family phage major capsid protein
VPYNTNVGRTDAAALIPEEYSHDIVRHLPSASAALGLFRQVPMSRAQLRIPAESALAVAYWVSGDTGIKQTSKSAWANLYLNAEELAVIVPVPETVLDDVDFDLWGLIRPQLVEAIGRALDAAIFFGVNKPASWPADIQSAAIAAGNTTLEAATQVQGGIIGDVGNAFATVEADGFDVNGVIAARTLKGKIRAARSTTGEQLAEPAEGSGEAAQAPIDVLYSVPVRYPMRGLWPTGTGSTEAIVGDFTQGLIGVRQDLTFKILDQAVISDGAGAIQFNLAQQDMVAVRVVARFAFQVPNPLTYDQPTQASRYPFGVLHVA